MIRGTCPVCGNAMGFALLEKKEGKKNRYELVIECTVCGQFVPFRGSHQLKLLCIAGYKGAISVEQIDD